MRFLNSVFVIMIAFASALASETPRECPVNPALPDYPIVARGARVEGTVELQLGIDDAGKVVSVSIISGHPMFVQPTIDLVERWRFSYSVPGPTKAKARSFKMKFVYRFDEDADAEYTTCNTSRIVIRFPTVEILGVPPKVQTIE